MQDTVSYNIEADKSQGHVPTRHTMPCPMCSSDHDLFGCDQFKQMKPNDRFQFVRERRLCDNCLRPGHMAYRCRRNTVCTVPGCGLKHTKFVHRMSSEDADRQHDRQHDRQQPDASMNSYTDATCNLTGAGNVLPILPVVPVRVMTSDGKLTITTYALLDSGSTNTFCSKRLLNDLGIEGQKQKLCLTTLEKQDSLMDTELVCLELIDMNGTTGLQLPRVFAKATLPINIENIVMRQDVLVWPHLRDIHLTKIEVRRIDLLIGQGAPEALVPLEVRRGRRGELYLRQNSIWSKKKSCV